MTTVQTPAVPEHEQADRRRRLVVRNLGRRPLEPVWRQMQAFTDERDSTATDEVWLVEHPPVYTLGLNGRRNHVVQPGTIPVVPIDRGGQVTYHGPGQLVAYLLLDLKRSGLGVKRLVERIEQAIIETLLDYGVSGERRAGAPGVYVAGAKIAALGLRVRKGCCYHGLALNVDMDLEPFAGINPCGFEGLAVTQLRDHTGPVSLEPVATVLVQHLAANLHYATTP